MSKPANLDYKFFYSIMQQYQSMYGKDAKVDLLPEFYLNPNDTLEEAAKKIFSHINLVGEEVIVNIPVRTVMTDMSGKTILEYLDVNTEMTYGRVIASEPDPSNGCTVRYNTQVGTTLETRFLPKDIIAWGHEDVKRYKPNCWNCDAEGN